MSRKAIVAGVAALPFARGAVGDPVTLLATQAVRLALRDAGLDHLAIQQAYVSHTSNEPCGGQTALYGVALTGVPIVNVNNSCASGATALYLARQAVESGAVDCAIAVGFDDSHSPEPGMFWSAHARSMARHAQALDRLHEIQADVPLAVQLFAGAARMHMRMFGTREQTFAGIVAKSRAHAAKNPNALMRSAMTIEQVLRSKMVAAPLTLPQCCFATRGAAAVILCSPAFARRSGIDASVSIAGQALRSDRNSSFDENDARKLAGYDMTRGAALAAYTEAGVGPDDVQVCEVHDCFTSGEVLAYEALGLVVEGEAERFILDGDNTYGGRVVTNPSGGLLAMGHCPGATGLAQCAELVHQLRGNADARQVAQARVGLQQNLGIGGACVVTIYMTV